MENVLIEKLIWNEWNISHIKKHNVQQKEVELSLKDTYVVFIKGQENEHEYYVVTARDMAKQERAIYRQEKVIKERSI